MKIEVASGGVIVIKALDVWHVLLIRDMNNSWTFPKGIIEKNENPKEAALREILEETGLTDLSYLASLSTIRYTYRKMGLIQKTVHYFLFRSSRETPPVPLPQKEEGISEARWVTFEEAEAMLGYGETNQKLLKKAKIVILKA
ncbi:NUDIX domain-containing protein [Candidatus Gottesmanbacteria bacterium]|nr:NUDIX domain-containing protein [Candidatus Gottesmanbacteria bacterium]